MALGDVNDPDLGFTQIGGVVVDDDGYAYVLERTDRQVRVYDREGNRIRVIGRSGEGPGEFRASAGLGLLGDTLWVGDPAAQRFTLFMKIGELLTTYTIRPVTLEMFPGLPFFFSGSRLRPDGLVSTSFGVSIVANPPTDSVWVPHLLMDRTGAVVDTMRLERWAYPVARYVTVDGQRFRVPDPPATDPLYVETVDGEYIVERPSPAEDQSASFFVARFGIAGDTIFRREFRYDPAPFPQEAIDALIAPSIRTITTVIQTASGGTQEVVMQSPGSDSAASVAAIRDALSLPRFQPPVSDAHGGGDGSLWLRMHDEGTSMFRWLVVAPDGEPRGVIALPREATIHWSSLNEVWVELPGEFDVPWLYRYSIR